MDSGMTWWRKILIEVWNPVEIELQGGRRMLQVEGQNDQSGCGNTQVTISHLALGDQHKHSVVEQDRLGS